MLPRHLSQLQLTPQLATVYPAPSRSFGVRLVHRARSYRLTWVTPASGLCPRSPRNKYILSPFEEKRKREFWMLYIQIRPIKKEPFGSVSTGSGASSFPGFKGLTRATCALAIGFGLPRAWCGGGHPPFTCQGALAGSGNAPLTDRYSIA